MPTQQQIDWTIAVSIIFPISTAAIILRIVAMRARSASPKLRDYLVFLCFFCQVVYMVHMSIGVTLGGYGHHALELSAERLMVTLKIYFSQQFVWATGTLAFRVSILLFYHEIFQFTRFRWAIMGSIIVVVSWWAACIIAICLLCRPISFNWDRSITGTCVNIDVIYMFTAAFNMFLDILVVFLPLPMVWKLQLTTSKKWSITASFALGFCTAGVNLGRLIQNANCPALDVSYCALDSCILVIAELAGGILTATVPTLGPILARFVKAKPTPESDEGSGKIRTIGSIPLRPRWKKPSTLNSSLFSRNESQPATRVDTKWQQEEPSGPLTQRAAEMGHMGEGSNHRISEEYGDQHRENVAR